MSSIDKLIRLYNKERREGALPLVLPLRNGTRGKAHKSRSFSPKAQSPQKQQSPQTQQLLSSDLLLMRACLLDMRISIPAPVPQYPDHIAAPAPIGMRENVRRAAAQAGMSSAAFVRAAIAEKLQAAEGTRA